MILYLSFRLKNLSDSINILIINQCINKINSKSESFVIKFLYKQHPLGCKVSFVYFIVVLKSLKLIRLKILANKFICNKISY